MILNVDHQTEYRYSESQSMIVQSHRLYPALCDTQKIVSWEVSCKGANFGSYFRDGSGDQIRTMSIINGSDAITIHVRGQVDTLGNNNGVIKLSKEILIPQLYLGNSDKTMPSSYLMDAAMDAIDDAQSTNLEKAHALNKYVNQTIQYMPGSTDSSSTADQVIQSGQGVCQDQTHCLIVLARLHKIPARYVTGYLFTDAQGQQHDASHAWAEVYIDDLGWVGFDATNACCPDQRYIRIGCGIDAQDASLIRGVYRSAGNESMLTRVEISGMQQ